MLASVRRRRESEAARDAPPAAPPRQPLRFDAFVRPFASRPVSAGPLGALPGERWRGGAGLLAVAVAAVAMGAVVARWPIAGIGLAVLVAVGTFAVNATRLMTAQTLLVILPWLVVFDDVVPPMTRSLSAIATAIALLALSWPLRYRSVLGPAAVGLLIVAVVIQALFATNAEQLEQAVRYLIFPALALAVLSERARTELPKLRDAVIVSGLVAMAVHLVIALSGLGSAGTKYGVGERLGLAALAPHELALLAVVIAAAGLTMSERVGVRAGFFALGALPALLTGVRSALLAIALILLMLLFESRANARSVAVVAIAVVLGLAGGAGTVLTERLSSTLGEGATVESASSSRIAIWGVALDLWADSGPTGWAFGTGLRSIPEAQEFELGIGYVGHSDVIEVGVQLGAIALIAWLLVWLALFRSGLRSLIFVPVVVYAAVNGAINYPVPTALALVLAGACARRGSTHDGRVARADPVHAV